MNLFKTLVAAAAVTFAVPTFAAEEAGAFKVPGTETTLKFNGFAETALFYQFQGGFEFLYTGCDYYICPSAIALSGQHVNNWQAAMTVAYTRFGVQSSTPTPVGVVGTRIEIDAAKGYQLEGQTFTHSSSIRIRHGYGTVGETFLMGQTWSTFADLNTFPDQMDENPFFNLAALRAPMIRVGFPVGGAKLTFALEDPYFTSFNATTLAKGAPTNTSAFWNVPDFIGRLDFVTGPASLSLRGVVKQYRTQTASTAGGGGAVGAAVKLGEDTLVLDVSGGPGIGTYIYGATISPAGGLPQDAMQIGTSIKTWKVVGASAGFTHVWTPVVRSNLMVSGIWTSSNSDIQNAPGNAAAYNLSNKQVYSVGVNTYWQPAKIFWIGLEGYYNERKNFADQHGEEWRAELVGHFNLL
jgi:hypothetical protein